METDSDIELIIYSEQKCESRTTSFSQIRQRSASSYVLGSNSAAQLPPQAPQNQNQHQHQPVKKSIGIQHPPPSHCDQSVQARPPHPRASSVSAAGSGGVTNTASPTPPQSTIVCMLVATADKPNINKNDLIRCARLAVRQAAQQQQQQQQQQTNPKRSHSLTVQPPPTKKCSLPDLTFLNEYSSTTNRIPPPQQQIQQTTSPINPAPEILKRKTLKSIKRYRQTKQNTEPCGTFQQQVQSPPPTLQQQYNESLGTDIDFEFLKS